MEDVVTSLQSKYGYELEIIRANEVPFFKRLVLPAFPAVYVDGELFSKGRPISQEQLAAEIEQRLPAQDD